MTTFKEWFDATYRDLDGGTTGLPGWLADDLLLAWNAGQAAGSSGHAPSRPTRDEVARKIQRVSERTQRYAMTWDVALQMADEVMPFAAIAAEPVAWRWRGAGERWTLEHSAPPEPEAEIEVQPLYAAPTTSPEPDAVSVRDAFPNATCHECEWTGPRDQLKDGAGPLDELCPVCGSDSTEWLPADPRNDRGSPDNG